MTGEMVIVQISSIEAVPSPQMSELAAGEVATIRLSGARFGDDVADYFGGKLVIKYIKEVRGVNTYRVTARGISMTVAHDLLVKLMNATSENLGAVINEVESACTDNRPPSGFGDVSGYIEP